MAEAFPSPPVDLPPVEGHVDYPPHGADEAPASADDHAATSGNAGKPKSHDDTKATIIKVVIIGLVLGVGAMIVMGIVNQVSKTVGNTAKNIFNACKYLAYVGAIFAALSLAGKYAANKMKEAKGEGDGKNTGGDDNTGKNGGDNGGDGTGTGGETGGGNI